VIQYNCPAINHDWLKCKKGKKVKGKKIIFVETVLD